MLIQLNQKQLKLQNELREYFEGLITPALRAELNQPEHFEGGGPEFKKAMRTLGSDGWIGLILIIELQSSSIPLFYIAILLFLLEKL